MTEQDNLLLSQWSRKEILGYYNGEKKRAKYYLEKQIPTKNHHNKVREILRQYGRARMCFDRYDFQGKSFIWLGCLSAAVHLDNSFTCDIAYAMTYGEGGDMGYIAVNEYTDDIIIISSEMIHHVRDYYKEKLVEQFILPIVSGIRRGAVKSQISDDGIIIDEYAFRCHRPEEGLIVCDEKIPIQVYRNEHKDLVDMRGWLPLPNLFTPMDYVDESCHYTFFVVYMLLGDIVNQFIDWSKTDFDQFTQHAIDIVGQSAISDEVNSQKFADTLVEEATKVLWHFKHDCTKEDVALILPNLSYYNYVINFNNKLITKNTMDKKLTESLRKTLKSYGLKSKFENLVKAARTTEEAWYSWAEPLYAISRLRPYITNEKDNPKFLSADKEWAELIVNEDRCSALDEYVKKYGKSVVTQAIHYLMDNNLWEAPIGVKDIRKVTSETYKGVKAIDEAVEFLRSEGMLNEEEPQQNQEEQAQEDTTDKTHREPVTGTLSDAMKDYNECEELFHKFHVHFSALSAYFNQDELSKLLEEENTKLEQENKKLLKENDRLEESIRIVNQQLGEQKKETKKHQQIAYDAVQDKNKHIDNFNKLKKQYEEMNEEYDYLKREVKKASETPVAKIVPVSKLRDIPLVGNGVLKGLIPLLRKYNIVVDEKH